MDNIFDGYKCPMCNGTLRITKRLLNCGQNEWHELNRIVCNHCKVKSAEMECDLKQYKEKYWHSFNEAVKRKRNEKTRKNPHRVRRKVGGGVVKREIIAVDFDGTLFTDEYPETGKPIWKVINYCKEQQRNGAILILWTCRNGNDLLEAVELCREVGLVFDYVNENTRENLARFGGIDNRKIYADIYIDDKAINVRALI